MGGKESEVGREEMSEGKGRWGGVGRDKEGGRRRKGGRERWRSRVSKDSK